MNTLQNGDNGGHCLFFWQDPAIGKMDIETTGFTPNAWFISAFLRGAALFFRQATVGSCLGPVIGGLKMAPDL
jgi:hypothetical protein